MHPLVLSVHPRRCLLALSVSLVLSGPALAQPRDLQSQQPDASTLDTIQVIGARPVVDLPGQVERRVATTVRDVFDLDASVDVGGGTRNGQRLYVRGVEASNLSVTVDGARQGSNLYNHRGGLGNVDPAILKRVEVAAGPVSADAGYGALAGSVRFTTVDAQDRLAQDRQFGGSVRLAHASATGAESGAVTLYGLAAGVVGLLAHASTQEYDDLRVGGGGRIPYSGGRDRSAVAKLSLLDVQGHSLRAGVQAHRASGYNYMQRGDYPWQVQPPEQSRPPQDQTLARTSQTLQYQYAPGHALLDVQLNLANTRDDFFAPNSGGERFISEGRSADLRNVARWHAGWGETALTTGLEWVDQQGLAKRDSAPSGFSTGTRNTGVYTQARFSGAQWDVSLGARHDRYDSDYGSRSSEGSANSLNAQAQWRFDNGLRVHAGYGEAIRGFGNIPLQFTRNIAQNLTFNGSSDGVLRPERGRQSELGLAYTAQDVLGARVLEVGVKRYLTRLQDAILFDQPGTGGLGGRPVTGFSNQHPSVRFEGTEWSVHWIGAWLRSSLTAIDGRAEHLPSQAQFLARMGAPAQGRLVSDWQFDLPGQWRLSYTFTAVEGLDDPPAGQAVFIQRPGYSLHDIQVGWRAAGLRDWGLSLAVHNLLDRRYSTLTTFTEQGFATEEAGRDVRLSLDVSF